MSENKTIQKSKKQSKNKNVEEEEIYENLQSVAYG